MSVFLLHFYHQNKEITWLIHILNLQWIFGINSLSLFIAQAFVIAAFSIFCFNLVSSTGSNCRVDCGNLLCFVSSYLFKTLPHNIQFATWHALLCALLGWHELALGALVTLGRLCFKEYFCFRVPLLNLQPAFVAALWLLLGYLKVVGLPEFYR